MSTFIQFLYIYGFPYADMWKVQLCLFLFEKGDSLDEDDILYGFIMFWYYNSLLYKSEYGICNEHYFKLLNLNSGSVIPLEWTGNGGNCTKQSKLIQILR